MYAFIDLSTATSRRIQILPGTTHAPIKSLAISSSRSKRLMVILICNITRLRTRVNAIPRTLPTIQTLSRTRTRIRTKISRIKATTNGIVPTVCPSVLKTSSKKRSISICCQFPLLLPSLLQVISNKIILFTYLPRTTPSIAPVRPTSPLQCRLLGILTPVERLSEFQGNITSLYLHRVRRRIRSQRCIHLKVLLRSTKDTLSPLPREINRL